MKRWLRFLFVSLYALSGCAPATAPLPPLATPIPDSPQEYHVGPLRWQEDTVVTYAMQEAQEGRRGNAVTTEAAQHVVEFRAVERTTLGQFWVRCALDGAEVADVLVERDGDTVVVHLKSPAHPLAWKALLPLMRHAERLAKTPKRLRRGEPVRVTLPGSFVLPFVPKWAWPGFAKELEMEWVFTGHVRVGEALAAALTTRSANLLTRQVCGEADRGRPPVCLADIRLENTEYRDPTSAHLVVGYDLTTATGTVEGSPVTFRFTTLTTLDRQRSRGW